MPHIFISYAKRDARQLAEALYNALNAIPGLTAWMDMSLEPGESWEHQIQREIDRADVVVVLLSEDVNREATADKERSFVRIEIAYAKQVKKYILPVMVQHTKIPLRIADLQHIDLTATPNDPTKVIEHVCKRFDITYTLPPSHVSVSDNPPAILAGVMSRVIGGRSAVTFGIISLLVIAVVVALSILGNNPNLPDVTQTAAGTPTEAAQIILSAPLTLTPSSSPTATPQPTETVVPTHTPPLPSENPTATSRPTNTLMPSDIPPLTNTRPVTSLPATSILTPTPTPDPCVGKIYNPAGSSATYYRQAQRSDPASIPNNTIVRIVENDEYKYDPTERRRYYKIEFGSQSGFIYIDHIVGVTRVCAYYEEP